VAATGAGKTILFSHLAARQEGRTLILAHREELIRQAVEKLHAATGIHATVERAEQRAMPGHRVIVASVQSMRRRLKKYASDAFDLIICDEAHHVLAAEWQAVLTHFSGCPRILGVTATPDRTDKRSLGEFFERVAFEVGLIDLIREGYLVDLRTMKLDVEIDLSSMRKAQRDFTPEELAAAVHPRLALLAEEVSAQIWDRKALIFLPLCELSEKFAFLLRGRGINCDHVSGMSHDRQELLEWFATPGPKALCDAMLLTEGFDQPDVDAIVCLRPTKSRALYSQIIGRGTRLSPGKDHCLILDPLWLTEKHSLCQPADLTGGDELHKEKLKEQLDLGVDLLEAEEVAKANAAEALAEKLEEAKREAVRLKRLAMQAPKGMIDPKRFCDILGYHGALTPLTDGEIPASMLQSAALSKLGIWPDKLTHGDAAFLLDLIERRKVDGLASPAQVMLLDRLGEANASRLSKGEAGHTMSVVFKGKRHVYRRRGR
jgi:superfamily II DNA or RNA helicase